MVNIFKKMEKVGLVGVLLLLSGCADLLAIPSFTNVLPSNELHVDVPVKPATIPLQRDGKEIVILVADYIDARDKPSRKLGKIHTVVTNMYGNELILDQDIPNLISSAVRKQLSANGFKVVSSTTDAHDFELIGVINNFSLDIADRDELAITIETTLTHGQQGKVLWSGTVAEISNRFAGVSGNSHNTIAEYLANGIVEVVDKTGILVKKTLIKTYPSTIGNNQSQVEPSLPGVMTLQAASNKELVATPAVNSTPVKEATGYFSVTSSPAHAKIYIDDVYYGLTPIKLALNPGVYTFKFELDGYKVNKEKVSIRSGETTELEIKFRKQLDMSIGYPN